MNEFLEQHDPSAIAILDTDRGTETTYGALRERVAEAAEHLRGELGRGLVFQVGSQTPESVVLYMACLEAGCPVALLEPGPPDRLAPLLEAHRPAALLLPEALETPQGFQPAAPLPMPHYRAAVRSGDPGGDSLHPELALLLATSGSTGSPKLVRLSRANLRANARSIVKYLGIHPGERSIQSLPMHYSYGLSLVNSHLAAGATLVLTQHSFLRPEFWGAFDAAGCTSFAGVPYVYETLHRLRFDPKRHPSLGTMTQAGGGLRSDLIRSFHERTAQAGCRFFVMYGQTEATARISYVPIERLAQKIGSIGIAIPDGRLSLAPLAESDQQELIYEGPNVMLGYADSAADLALGDQLRGRLRTGDLARVDNDGFFYLTGRLKRFAKLFGRRISLEDVEGELETRYPILAAATERDGQLKIFAAPREEALPEGIGLFVARRLNVPPSCVCVERVAEIPLTSSGKKDYKALPS